jgi:NhaP-type Na+/H+ or K+/H+ antiporter
MLAMSELVIGLLVGSCIGYGFRALISHRRRVASKRRLGLI